MSSSEIKRTWVVCGDVSGMEWDDSKDATKEFTTAKAAITRAKTMVQTTENTEAWVYGLTHVIARPATEPTVDVVK